MSRPLPVEIYGVPAAEAVPECAARAPLTPPLALRRQAPLAAR